MKSFIFQIQRTALLTVLSAGILVSCNKKLPDAIPIVTTPPTGSTIFETIRSGGATYSYLDSAIARASGFNNPAGRLDALLKDNTAIFTLFAPDNNAFQRSFQLLGLPIDVSTLKLFSAGRLDSILRYHLIGGLRFPTQSFPSSFPFSLYLQSNLILQAPSASLPPGYRMPVFPGKLGNTAFANNVPIVQADLAASNGILHRTSLLLLPPTRVLWERIATDPDMTYLKAAVEKGDQGDAAKTLETALRNPAANLTVMAPTNLAFQQLLTGQITLALIGMGVDPQIAAGQAAALASTPAVFNHPALANVLTPTLVKGIVVYHLLAEKYNNVYQGIRAFTVNMPTTDTPSLTLLNSAIPPHPGVTLKATFGFSGIIAATAKGVGNPIASNIQINPTPEPAGTSDQHYVNGTLHKIDQVLLPQ